MQCFDGQCRVVCLGAGYDTLPMRLARDRVKPEVWVDIDMSQNAEEREGLMGTTLARGFIDTPVQWHFNIGHDLRKGLPELPGSPDLPTLFIAECLFMYLEPKYTGLILAQIAMMRRTCIVTYDAFNPNDGFGKIMIRNLKQRGLSLEGVLGCPTLEDQRDRLSKAGFKVTAARDCKDLFDNHIDKEAKETASRKVMIDEWEQFNMLIVHYCCTFGDNGTGVMLL
ncbi:leucine carboxyl methyltransferase [Kipferlia bialata]|uniref:[phosphatase 2A protein]-leucine-carboxy methyltransferase n=1 Tax=Kipferlia bialata TaxID=797122 RepID=A0A9K3GLL5_9EUKA|nr:leucine carboxyl methyltransferase [Kipferlia bialata]|eukprot:g8789.t1